MDINYIIFLLIFFISTLIIFRKFQILKENISYSEHKSLGKTNKSPILIGGFFIISVIITSSLNNFIFFKAASILIFLVGILSDKNILHNPKLRLFFQISVIFFLVYFEKLNINGVSLNFIDYLLGYEYFNYFFTIFCFAVLVNGSNFIDGLNGLLSGYIILILISIFIILNNYISIDTELNQLVNILIIASIIFYIFNIFGIVYLGDSGSYLLSFSIGFILIKMHQETILISPYYIATVLWYPAFENLFSLIRRFLNKSYISSADKLHLHQLIFRYFRSKNLINKKWVNTLSGFTIVLVNLPSIYIATKYYYHSIYLINTIIFNLIFYLLIYYSLFKNFRSKK